MNLEISLFLNKIEFNVFSIENGKKKIILSDEIMIPVSFAIGDKLSYIRKFMYVLMNRYKIGKASLKAHENSNGLENIELIKIIGVMEELFSSCGVELCK